MTDLQQRLRYVFRDAGLLRQALTHRSHGARNNERLEFIGDSVLNLAVAALLYAQAGASEGQLSYWRASLVREQTLAEIARELELGAALLMGEGEQRSGGAARASILADALEAVLGAVFLDGGFEAARELVARLYAPRLSRIDTGASAKDAKTRLQEILQGRRLKVPGYAVTATRGPAHLQEFEVQCEIAELGLRTHGEGTSRRAAEQQAAQAMIGKLEGQA
jgi:ribonuclease-3